MNKKLLIPVLFLMPSITSNVWAECAIEQGPPPEVVQYISDVQAELAQIKSEVGGTNKCNGPAGTFGSERRFLEFLDRVDLDGSAVDGIVGLPQDMALDFMYNVTFAFEGNSRGPVTNQGKLFKDLENRNIIPAIESIAAKCSLDTALASGGTPESRMSAILKTNRAIERFFWSAATGDPTIPSGLDKHTALLESIQINYSLEATSACKSDYEIEDIVSTIMTKLGNLTKGTKDGHKAWEDAIALFQGKNKGTAEYVKLQSRLLQTEMARQGLSQNAKKAILKNLTCPEQKTDPTSSPEERTKAEFDCHRSYVTGFDTVVKGLTPKILQSKTTTEYITRVLTYSREKNRISSDMPNFWSNLVKLQSADEPLNEKLLNDLVNIHSELISTSDSLGKIAIPKMKENCDKGNTSVKC